MASNNREIFSIDLKTRKSGSEKVWCSFVRLVIFIGKYFGILLNSFVSTKNRRERVSFM